MSDLDDVRDLATAKAIGHGLEPSLVMAVVQIESSGRRYAWNPEPRYEWLWDVKRNRPFRELTDEESLSESPPGDFPAPPGVDRDAEWWGQQASWGLMQVMGAVARERGLRGPDLPAICDPHIGLEIGCRHLANFIRRYGLEEGVGAYNAGPGGRTNARARAYVAKVMACRAHHEEPVEPDPDNAGAIG